MARRTLVAVAISALTWSLGGVAFAAWSASGSGPAETVALTMPVGQTPRVAARSQSVSVSWSANTFSSGAAVEGYVIARHDATTGAGQPIGSGCNGTITTTSCTETTVPSGSWTYTVTPIQGGWHGAESPQSSVVTMP
jgi:hypothetical protein